MRGVMTTTMETTVLMTTTLRINFILHLGNCSFFWRTCPLILYYSNVYPTLILERVNQNNCDISDWYFEILV